MITRKDLMQFHMQERLESLLTLTTVVGNGSATNGSGFFSDANNNTMPDGLDRKYSGSSTSRDITATEKPLSDTISPLDVSIDDRSMQNAGNLQKGVTSDDKAQSGEPADNSHDRDQFDCKPIEFAVARESGAAATARTNNRPADGETGWETPF
jgi:hypothetical protein